MTKTLIMGIGNVLRADDGFGSAVIDALSPIELPENIELLDAGTPGFELVLTMQGYDRVIVIDAADMDCQPGTVRVFTPDEVRLKSGDLYLRGTLHYAGLAEALNLGAALNLLPAAITIIGIQPVNIDWIAGLSAPVAEAIPTVCAAILSRLETANKDEYYA